jgi:hypothetical protein
MTKLTIEELTDKMGWLDIEFYYKNEHGFICPFAPDNISIGFLDKELTVHSYKDVLTQKFIDGKSLTELCDEIDFDC